MSLPLSTTQPRIPLVRSNSFCGGKDAGVRLSPGRGEKGKHKPQKPGLPLSGPIRIRTVDIILVRDALYQLSYRPCVVCIVPRFVFKVEAAETWI